MLELIVVAVLVLWLLGFFARRSSFIHLLLAIVLILVLLRFLR